MDHLKPGYPLGDGMISDKIEARQLITLGADGVLVRGTYHEVPRKAQDGSNAQGKNVGVVFLNPLSTPRTLIGDSAVFWASSFAAQGYQRSRLCLHNCLEDKRICKDFRPIGRGDLWALCRGGYGGFRGL
jgi:hypothetical protein